MGRRWLLLLLLLLAAAAAVVVVVVAAAVRAARMSMRTVRYVSCVMCRVLPALCVVRM